jgi:hypothetical protein
MKWGAIILLFMVLVVSVGLTVGQDKMKTGKALMKMETKETTVKGEVVDVSCYLAHGSNGMGNDHQSCAVACAKAGGPLGILTKEMKLYVSVLPDDHSAGPNAKLIDHVGHNVEVTGMVRVKGGVNGIMIKNVTMAAAEEKK